MASVYLLCEVYSFALIDIHINHYNVYNMLSVWVYVAE